MIEQPTLFGGIDNVETATGHTTIAGPAMHVLHGVNTPAGDTANGLGVAAQAAPMPFQSGIPSLVLLGSRCYAQGLDDGLNNTRPLPPLVLLELTVHALECPEPPEDMRAVLYRIYEGGHAIGVRLRPPRKPMQRGGPRL